MNLPFTKMHGIGNDFVIIDLEKAPADLELSVLATQLCDRKFGIGADGLLVAETSESAPFFMRMFNPDGSESEMCGNGLRCFAQYLVDEGRILPEPTSIDTGRGVLNVEFPAAGMVRVDMGEPSLLPREIGMALINLDVPFLNQNVGGGYLGSAVSMGNPHLVIFTESVAAIPLEKIGPEFEKHPFFPNRVNVHFAEVKDRGHLVMRTWERGAGITLACGTGACAVAVAAQENGLADESVRIDLPGGTLEIIREKPGHVFMTGPAVTTFKGVLTA